MDSPALHTDPHFCGHRHVALRAEPCCECVPRCLPLAKAIPMISQFLRSCSGSGARNIADLPPARGGDCSARRLAPAPATRSRSCACAKTCSHGKRTKIRELFRRSAVVMAAAPILSRLCHGSETRLIRSRGHSPNWRLSCLLKAPGWRSHCGVPARCALGVGTREYKARARSKATEFLLWRAHAAPI